MSEDPWERLRKIKELAPNTPVQMLLRGQNLVGYRRYAEDVVERFVELSAQNGVDIFRIFDALNDVRNMATAIRAVKKAGKHAQGAMSYTTSPFHTVRQFAELGIEMQKMGCDSICVKDMAGVITPAAAAELVGALKRSPGLPVVLHSHCTAGMAPMAYQAAIEAGVDRLDCAISPFAGGTSQPPTESVAYSLKDTPRNPGLDLAALTEATEYFREVRQRYETLIDPISERVDTRALSYQVPGGMLSNLISQLKQQKRIDRLQEVLQEVPRVRADCGYPPLVTPSSQIVGVQAVLNVLMGSRYRVVHSEMKNLVKGMYGRSPAPIAPEILKKILGDEKPVEGRPADYLEPELEKLAAKYGDSGMLARPEDLLTMAMNPDVGQAFLGTRC